MLSYIFWDPKKEIFFIPKLNFPIVWYSVLFALGFFIGYYIFVSILKRYFAYFPKVEKSDVVSYRLIVDVIKDKKNRFVQEIFSKVQIKQPLLEKIKEVILEKINFFIKNSYKKRLQIDSAFSSGILSLKKKAHLITDRLTVYIVIATIIGARLGHLLFYESPAMYLKNPLIILQTWKGGLSSHGGSLAILIALIFFCRFLKKYSPKIDYIHLLDLMSIPVALVAVFIRLGNFFNQEILGIPTQMPWGIIFLHPSENVAIVPRHPVQLYEAIFYLITFIFLYYLSLKKYFLLEKGKLIGLFLILVYGFRFFIEFLKIKQSDLIADGNVLLMGQYLSIPFIILGIIFFFWKNIFLKK